MTPNQKNGRVGRLIRRSVLLLVTVVLLAVIGIGMVLNKIFTGPSPAARDALVMKLKQSASTEWIPELFLDSDTIAQILADNDSVHNGSSWKEG